GLRNTDIARKVGVDSRRVSDRLKALGLKRNKRRFNDQPTEEQEKVFISMFIGDGAIYKSEGNKNYRVNLAHSDKQKDYFLMKYNKVKDFIGVEYFKESQFHKKDKKEYHAYKFKYREKYYKIKSTKKDKQKYYLLIKNNKIKEFIGVEYFKESQFHKKAKKEYHAYKFQSRVNPYFTRMREVWYKDGKKIIPKLIKDKLDDEIMAYKFFDDGWLTASGYSIAMNDYDVESVNNLRQAMKENLGIETNLQEEGKIMYIPASGRGKFREIVEPYATKD